MAHHGWIPVIDPSSLTPAGLKSPFGRLFPAADHEYNSHALALLGGALGPLQRLTSVKTKGNNPTGFTFFGQFIDHDMTEFRVIGSTYALIQQNPTIGQRQLVLEDRRLEHQVPTATNGRTGKLDLDSVYGLLGLAQPDLYTTAGAFRMQSNERDIPRGNQYHNGRLIADPRNDENKIVVQIHVLFERLHNKIHATKSGPSSRKGPGGDLFAETKAQVQQIYRSIIIHDYLPRIVRIEQLQRVAQALQQGHTCYQRMTARCRAALTALDVPAPEVQAAVAVPVEFAHAAFRLGHTQLQPGYRLNDDNAFPLFATGTGESDLRGNEALAPKFIIDWAYFFEGGAHPPQPGAPIDGVLPEGVFRLPPPAIDAPPVSLAERNLRRGVDFGLPSGQEAAAILTEQYGYIHATTFEELFPDALQKQFKEILALDPTLAWRTPLWYYIIREAEYRESGPELGPVGGYIVAETLLGSLAETDGVGINLLLSELNALVDPTTLSTTAPADPNAIQTMAQLVSFLQTP